MQTHPEQSHSYHGTMIPKEIPAGKTPLEEFEVL